jgi:chromosome segregation ATPase
MKRFHAETISEHPEGCLVLRAEAQAELEHWRDRAIKFEKLHHEAEADIRTLLKKLDRSNEAWTRAKEELAEKDAEIAYHQAVSTGCSLRVGQLEKQIASLKESIEGLNEIINGLTAELERKTVLYEKVTDDFASEVQRLTAERDRLKKALEEIESMATIETVEIQKIAQAAIKGVGVEG